MLDAIVIAIVLGIAAQVLAERFRLPAILPLLIFGMVAGPSVLGWFDPAELGEGLEVLVHVGVAVILFEGGLSLNLKQLSRVGGAVRNLLTLGAAITTFASAWLAHVVIGLPWPTAFLFGAIVMVTGPTVIAPLLRHMIAPRRLKVILTSEGLIIDAIGATVAYLVLQWVERARMPFNTLMREVLNVALAGIILGFVAGMLARFATRSRLFGGEIRNLAILSILLLCYLGAEHQAHQSGILASVVMGVTMSAGQLPDLGKIRIFKGQLTIFLISFVFVLLAAQLDLQAMIGLGTGGLLVVAGLIFAIRPLSVFLSIWPRQLALKERIALALTAPRGIVAAAVASLSAISLREAGIGGAETLEALVYLVILTTGVWATLMAIVLPRVLGYVDDPSRRRAVLVGANRLSEVIGEVIARTGRSVTVVDSVPWRMDRSRDRGFHTVQGDARDVSTYEEAGVERDTLLVAATTNDELNLLVAELVHQEFGVEHPVVTLQTPPEEFGTRSRAWIDLLGGRGVDIPGWIRRLDAGQEIHMVDIEMGDEEAVKTVRDLHRRWPKEVLALCGWQGSEVTFRLTGERWEDHARLTLLVTSGRPLEFLQTTAGEHLVRPDETPEEVVAGTEATEEYVAHESADERDEDAAGGESRPIEPSGVGS